MLTVLTAFVFSLFIRFIQIQSIKSRINVKKLQLMRASYYDSGRIESLEEDLSHLQQQLDALYDHRTPSVPATCTASNAVQPIGNIDNQSVLPSTKRAGRRVVRRQSAPDVATNLCPEFSSSPAITPARLHVYMHSPSSRSNPGFMNQESSPLRRSSLPHLSPLHHHYHHSNKLHPYNSPHSLGSSVLCQEHTSSQFSPLSITSSPSLYTLQPQKFLLSAQSSPLFLPQQGTPPMYGSTSGTSHQQSGHSIQGTSHPMCVPQLMHRQTNFLPLPYPPATNPFEQFKSSCANFSPISVSADASLNSSSSFQPSHVYDTSAALTDLAQQVPCHRLPSLAELRIQPEQLTQHLQSPEWTVSPPAMPSPHLRDDYKQAHIPSSTSPTPNTPSPAQDRKSSLQHFSLYLIGCWLSSCSTFYSA